jgi:hypothetical protein
MRHQLFLTIAQGRTGKLSPGSVFTIPAYVLLMHNKTVGLGRSMVRVGRVQPSAVRIAAMVKGPPKSETLAHGRPDVPDPAPGTQPATSKPQPDFTH